MIWMDVDAALSEVPVNIMPLIDDTDFKTREESVVFNQSGLDLVWNFVTTAGAYTQTAVTPTSAGDYDWSNQGNGMYAIEIPASGGASINNDAEGYGWFTGFATGILPWRGPIIGFRAAGLNNALIDSAYSATRGLAGTALPDAAADAAGGLPISDAGGLDLDAQATAAAQATAQADLDILTGTDGATLATSQPNYAPAVAGDEMALEDGAITAAKIASDAITAAKVAADVGVEIATAVWASGTRTLTSISGLGIALASKLTAYVQLLARKDSAIATDNAAELTEINADGGSGPGAYTNTTDAQEAIRDHVGDGTNLTEAGGDGDHLTAAGGDGSHLTEAGGDGDHLTEAGGTGDHLAAVATAAELAKVPKSDGTATWNATAAAQIQNEANDALVDNHLDHLLAATYDPASKPGAADALLNEMVESDAGVSRFTANALEQAPTGGSAPTAADIRAEIDANSTQLAAIVADTNELQADWANGGRLDLILDARASQTTADAIEADTQDLQSRTPAALVGGRMNASIGAVNGDATAAANLEGSTEVIVRGTVDTTGFSATTTEFESDDITEATADHYNGRVVIFRTGALAGQATTISDYALSGGRGHFTVPDLTDVPGNDDTFVIV